MVNVVDSGYVINGPLIEYGYQNTQWSVSCDDIRVVGEFTNNNGPYADDFYLVLIDNKEAVHVGSFYAPGRDFVDIMLKNAGMLDEYGLCNSAELRSRVLYPNELRGEPLYTFVEKRLMGIRGWLLRESEIECFVTENVMSYLRHVPNQSSKGS